MELQIHCIIFHIFFLFYKNNLGLLGWYYCSSLHQKKIPSLREFILFLHDPGEISDCVQAQDVCAIHEFDA